MVHKIQNNPFLPQGVHYVTQAGLFNNSSTTRHLVGFLKEHGSVTQLVNPHIRFGRRMEEAKKWLSDRIDQLRIELAKTKLSDFLIGFQGDVKDKDQWIKQYFSLKERDDLSNVIVRFVMNLFDGHVQNFHSLVQGLQSTQGDKLSEIVIDKTDAFRAELKESSLTTEPVQSQKIVNKVFDCITLRVAILGAHSQGGLTALQAMQDGNNDISMVIGWGAPVNGADPEKIPARRLVGKLFPMVDELTAGSEILQSTYNRPFPSDTSAFAVSLSNGKDGVILPNSLNPDFVNAHHVEVEPKEVKASSIVGGILYPVGFVFDHPLWFMQARAERNRYHIAYLDENNIPFYFSESKGSLLHEFAMSESSVRNICRLLNPENNSRLQTDFLLWLIEKVRKGEFDGDLTEVVPALEKLSDIQLPFTNNECDLARKIFELV